MSVKNFAVNFFLIFCITFVISILVSYLYSLIAHGSGYVDWSLSFRNGIIFGILFPLITNLNRSKK